MRAGFVVAYIVMGSFITKEALAEGFDDCDSEKVFSAVSGPNTERGKLATDLLYNALSDNVYSFAMACSDKAGKEAPQDTGYERDKFVEKLKKDSTIKKAMTSAKKLARDKTSVICLSGEAF